MNETPPRVKRPQARRDGHQPEHKMALLLAAVAGGMPPPGQIRNGIVYINIGPGYCRDSTKQVWTVGSKNHHAECIDSPIECQDKCSSKGDTCRGVAFTSLDKHGHCSTTQAAGTSSQGRCVFYMGDETIVTSEEVKGDDYTCFSKMHNDGKGNIG